MVSLADIIAATRRKLRTTHAQSDVRGLERQASAHIPRGFRKSLVVASDAGGAAIIAELKKASPSRGLIRKDFDPASLSRQLEKAGTAALSVLTDEDFFQGSLENLRVASSETLLPCLRKDFIVDEFQILEARANQADAILLIVAALSQKELTALSKRSSELHLYVLC